MLAEFMPSYLIQSLSWMSLTYCPYSAAALNSTATPWLSS